MFNRIIVKQYGWACFSLILLVLILIAPVRVEPIKDWLPVEALLIVVGINISGRVGSVIQYGVSSLLTLGILLKIADFLTYQVFSRAFNPVLDKHFAPDGWNLLVGNLGWLPALVVVILVFCLPVIVYLGLQRLLSSLRIGTGFSPSSLYSATGLVGLLVWLVFSTVPMRHSPFYYFMLYHAQQIVISAQETEEFTEQLAHDPYAGQASETLLDKLRGKDVLLIFVESYGRTMFDTPEYASVIKPILEQGQAQMRQQQIYSQSGYLQSPTYGGVSWLAHSTLLSGLWINNQSRYDRLVQSDRLSLNQLFKRAGWRTIGVQPAHTMDWPQGQYFGYDHVYSAKDLAYQGLPFNWITMPDQYTLAKVYEKELSQRPRVPVMAEMALISSHAPWSPLPDLIDWQQVGDGRIFIQARHGDSAETVWQDLHKIREQYAKSIAYTLQTLISYVLQNTDEQTVLVILGDHQPASFVTDQSSSYAVPIHIISRDPAVMEAISTWHWQPGMLPDDRTMALPMDQWRDLLLTTFSSRLIGH